MPVAPAPVALVVAMNLIYSLSAYPLGKLSDRMSHRKLLGFGLVVLIAADLVLATNDQWGVVLVGAALWGVHMGINQALLATMVADTSPADLRGRGLWLLQPGQRHCHTVSQRRRRSAVGRWGVGHVLRRGGI